MTLPSALDYQIEKLTQAVYDLATGQGDARSRIDEAYHRFWSIKADEFPRAVQEKRNKIQALITRLPAKQGHIIPENLKRMKNSTASNIAELILDMYFQLVRIRDGKEDPS